MEHKYYPALDEQLWSATLPNGLDVHVIPKPGFTKKQAYFITDFGAIHREFSFEGEDYCVPAGVAHYLEHKMFDLPGRDVSAEYAALGASVNAFTSYDLTAYYFSCTENFDAGLRLLLEFVSTPYFTEESVEKERGIIDQEIGMNLDEPGIRVFENLMLGLYHRHPIRTPILGSAESIRQITPEILQLCHRAFYTPANMILCVEGDVEPEMVCALARDILGDEKRPVAVKKLPTVEPMTHVQPEEGLEMDIAMPNFCLGFKCPDPGLGEGAIRAEVVGDLAAELLFGESSSLYSRLYAQGIIDSSFGGGYEAVDGCALLTCGGDSEDAFAVRDAILARARELQQEGITESQLRRMKRSAMGRRIRDLDSFDSTCFRICAYRLTEFDYFRFPEIYESVRGQELLDFLAENVLPEKCSLSLINPLQ